MPQITLSPSPAEQANLTLWAKEEKEGERLASDDRPLSAIGLSTRVRHWLGDYGIRTVGQLAVMPECDLMLFRGCGPKTLAEIKNALGGFREVSAPQRYWEMMSELMQARRDWWQAKCRADSAEDSGQYFRDERDRLTQEAT